VRRRIHAADYTPLFGGYQVILDIKVLFDMDFDVIASAVVAPIGFEGAYRNSDGIKTACAAYYNKNCSGDNGKNFF
jgi:hypothetical protein